MSVDLEEIATARHIAVTSSNQLMLKMLFEMLISMSDNPVGLRESLKQQLVELSGSMPLGEMDSRREAMVRGYVKDIVTAVLTNNPPSN